MLSIKILTGCNNSAVSKYYGEGADDYYANEGTSKKWQGKGAQRLGLDGEVELERFKQLLKGQVDPTISPPKSSKRLNYKRRIGIDLTFSAPKSVSIQALVGQDINVIKAHDDAVTEVIDRMEEYAQTRRKVDGVSSIETTGNLIVAKFRHETSRSIDPQLHTHAVVMYLTQRKDNQWRALKNENILNMTTFAGTLYRTLLAQKLEHLGYGIRIESNGLFELDHISRHQIESFSQRSSQIETLLTEQGLTRASATTTEKQQATLKSRRPKKQHDRNLIFKQWCYYAKELNLNLNIVKSNTVKQSGIHANSQQSKNDANKFDKPHPNSSAPPSNEKLEPDSLSSHSNNFKNPSLIKTMSNFFEDLKSSLLDKRLARSGVRYAIGHLSERQSVFTAPDIIDGVLKHHYKDISQLVIKDAIQAEIDRGELIPGDQLYQLASDIDPKLAKTEQVWVDHLVAKKIDPQAAQQKIKDMIETHQLVLQEPRYTTRHLLEAEKKILLIEKKGRQAVPAIYAKTLTAQQLASFELDDEQQQAVRMVISTTNQVTAIQGFAGTGKSHLLKAVQSLSELYNFKPVAIAPHGNHVRALKELGLESNTVSAFIKRSGKNQLTPQSLLIVDEAGVISTRTMATILHIAHASQSHVVLLGDTHQIKAIEAGKPFELLQKAGMICTALTTIRRQRDPNLKKAVEFATRMQLDESLQHMKNTVYNFDAVKRRDQIVADYMALSAKERQSTLILTGTNEARVEINQSIRENLKLKDQGHIFQTLERVDLTHVQKINNKYYQIGQIIHPEQNYSQDLKKNQHYIITAILNHNKLQVRTPDHRDIIFNPGRCSQLSVYEATPREFAVHDLVRITRGDKKNHVVNSELFTVTEVSPHQIELLNGCKKIILDTSRPLHLDHAYATTIHSSQGLTADRTLIDFKIKSPTTNYENYYVAISRARQESKLYASSKKILAPIALKTKKEAAHDIFSKPRLRDEDQYQK